VSQIAALLQADPRAAAVARQLRAQQVAAARLGLVIPAEYIDDVARQIVQTFQVDDLRNIKPQSRLVQVERETEQSSGVMGLVLAYDDPRNPWVEVVLEDGTVFSYGGTLFETTALPAVVFGGSSDGKLVYWLKWADPPGVVIVYTGPVRRAGGFFDLVGDALRDLAPLIGAAVTFGGLSSILNVAIFGPATVAAYPTATAAFTNLTLQTALTGGDIEAAARSAAASLVGAEFGNVVGSGLDSAQIGKVAAAAATAAVQGGDIDQAVIRALINIGAQSVSDYVNLPNGDLTDPVYDYGEPDYTLPVYDYGDYVTLDDIGVQLDLIEINDILAINADTLDAVEIDPSSLFPDEYGNLFLASGEFVELSDRVFVDSIYVDADGNVRAPDNNILIPQVEALNLTLEQLRDEIARQIDENAGKVLQPAPAPPSRPAATPPAASQTKWPIITDATKVLDSIGKLAAQLKSTVTAVQTGTYRPPAGGTSTTGTPRNTPVGVPITLPDGRVIVNNGNGTQTIRTPDGRVTTVPSSYAGTTGAGGAGGLLPGVSNQALLIGGAILVGAVLLARRR
jgi:hypothetical protein